jgi:hypothetical protein
MNLPIIIVFAIIGGICGIWLDSAFVEFILPIRWEYKWYAWPLTLTRIVFVAFCAFITVFTATVARDLFGTKR